MIKSGRIGRSNYSVVLFLSAALLLPSWCRAQAQANFNELEAVVSAELKERRIPGAAVALVKGDRVVFAKGFGVANVETGAPVTPEMLFRTASITKTFTAAALLTLAAEGKLKLNEPVGRYIKGLNPKISRLTAHQLLTHTSGLSDDKSVDGPHDDSALGQRVRSWDESYSFIEPGRLFSYSGLGYQLAGLVVEELGGQPYADFMSGRLFQPLGMVKTTFRPTVAMTYPLAQGHHPFKEGLLSVVRPYPDNAGRWPSTSMISNVNDLARFAVAFMNGGKIEGRQVLAPTVIAQMSEPRAEIFNSDDKYGYGLSVYEYRGARLLEHSGNTPGFGSILLMAPERRAAVIFLANRTGGRLDKTVVKALEMLLPLDAEVKSQRPEPAPPIAEAKMREYVGTYSNPYLGSMEVYAKDGKLFRKASGFDLRNPRVGVEVPVADASIFISGADGNPEYLYLGWSAFKKVYSR